MACNAPKRLRSTLERLATTLGRVLDDVRPGVLQMRYRSLEADLAAYDTPEGRAELPEEAFAMLRDLAASLEDLMGCYPQLAEIEAERLAQRVQDSDIPAVLLHMQKIRAVAETSEAVAPSAIEALKVGDEDIAEATEIIEGPSSETAISAAIKQRARIVTQKLLDFRNFVASALRTARTELAEVSTESWREVKAQTPKAVGKAAAQTAGAGVKVGLAGLVWLLVSPVASLGMFVMSFAPLGKAAENIAREPPKGDPPIDV